MCLVNHPNTFNCVHPNLQVSLPQFPSFLKLARGTFLGYVKNTMASNRLHEGLQNHTNNMNIRKILPFIILLKAFDDRVNIFQRY